MQPDSTKPVARLCEYLRQHPNSCQKNIRLASKSFQMSKTSRDQTLNHIHIIKHIFHFLFIKPCEHHAMTRTHVASSETPQRRKTTTKTPPTPFSAHPQTPPTHPMHSQTPSATLSSDWSQYPAVSLHSLQTFSATVNSHISCARTYRHAVYNSKRGFGFRWSDCLSLEMV